MALSPKAEVKFQQLMNDRTAHVMFKDSTRPASAWVLVHFVDPAQPSETNSQEEARVKAKAVQMLKELAGQL